VRAKKINLVLMGDNDKQKRDIISVYTGEEKLYFSKHSKTVNFNGENVELVLSDTANEGNFSPETYRTAYGNTDIFMLTFSLNDRKSLANIPQLASKILNIKPQALIMLVGANLDKRFGPEAASPPITYSEGTELQKVIGAISYFECDAISKKGLPILFEEAIKAVISPEKAPSKKEKKGWRKTLFGSGTTKEKSTSSNYFANTENTVNQPDIPSSSPTIGKTSVSSEPFIQELKAKVVAQPSSSGRPLPKTPTHPSPFGSSSPHTRIGAKNASSPNQDSIRPTVLDEIKRKHDKAEQYVDTFLESIQKERQKELEKMAKEKKERLEKRKKEFTLKVEQYYHSHAEDIIEYFKTNQEEITKSKTMYFQKIFVSSHPLLSSFTRARKFDNPRTEEEIEKFVTDKFVPLAIEALKLAGSTNIDPATIKLDNAIKENLVTDLLKINQLAVIERILGTITSVTLSDHDKKSSISDLIKIEAFPFLDKAIQDAKEKSSNRQGRT
jgi:Ras-related C3 botulinum toxin substrate 1